MQMQFFNFLTFTLNFSLWKEAGYFDASSEDKIFLHLWFLSIIMQFYLTWAMIVFLAKKQKEKLKL